MFRHQTKQKKIVQSIFYLHSNNVASSVNVSIHSCCLENDVNVLDNVDRSKVD